MLVVVYNHFSNQWDDFICPIALNMSYNIKIICNALNLKITILSLSYCIKKIALIRKYGISYPMK